MCNPDTDTHNNFWRADVEYDIPKTALDLDHWEDSARLDFTDDFAYRLSGPEPPFYTRLLKGRAVNRGKETTLGQTTGFVTNTAGLRNNPYM